VTEKSASSVAVLNRSCAESKEFTAACTDTAVRMSAAAVEAWLAGAVAAGAVVNRHQRDHL
jgi:hypothetical protein